MGPSTGLQAVKLEDMERRLRADVVQEALAWGGRVLLHRDVPRSEALQSPRARGVSHPAQPALDEDVTRKQEDNCVAAFWEATGMISARQILLTV